MKPSRGFFEKLLYPNLKPSGPKPASAPLSSLHWLGPLRGPVERFLSGGSSNDPLYLTHRSMSRKVLGWTAIALPFAFMITVLYMAAAGKFGSPPPAKVVVESPAEIAARILPNLKDVQLRVRPDLLVLEASINRGASPTLSGAVKNVSNRQIETAEIVFELADGTGSKIGRTRAQVKKIPPQETMKFTIPVAEHDAVYAIVLEIHSW